MVVGTSLIFWTIAGSYNHSIKSFVKQTQVHIDNIKRKFDDKNDILHVDTKYLEHLKLVDGVSTSENSNLELEIKRYVRRFIPYKYHTKNLFFFY